MLMKNSLLVQFCKSVTTKQLREFTIKSDGTLQCRCLHALCSANDRLLEDILHVVMHFTSLIWLFSSNYKSHSLWIFKPLD